MAVGPFIETILHMPVMVAKNGPNPAHLLCKPSHYLNRYCMVVGVVSSQYAIKSFIWKEPE